MNDQATPARRAAPFLPGDDVMCVAPHPTAPLDPGEGGTVEAVNARGDRKVDVRVGNGALVALDPDALALMQRSHTDVRCDACDQRIVLSSGLREVLWVHLDFPDEPHRAIPACSCAHGQDLDPYCRQHGVEDVQSGAYDLNPTVRARIDHALHGRAE